MSVADDVEILRLLGRYPRSGLAGGEVASLLHTCTGREVYPRLRMLERQGLVFRLVVRVPWTAMPGQKRFVVWFLTAAGTQSLCPRAVEPGVPF